MRWFGIRTPHLVASAKAQPVRRPPGWKGWGLIAAMSNANEFRLAQARRLRLKREGSGYAYSAPKGAYQERFDAS